MCPVTGGDNRWHGDRTVSTALGSHTPKKRLFLLTPGVCFRTAQRSTPREFYMRAADFSGCVKTMTGGSSKEGNLLKPNKSY